MAVTRFGQRLIVGDPPQSAEPGSPNEVSKTDVIVRKVIEAVRKRPVIWNCANKLKESTKALVDVQWAEVYSEIDPFKEKELLYYKMMWNRLRSSMHDYALNDTLEQHLLSNWRYFKDMEFYIDRVTRNKNSTEEDESDSAAEYSEVTQIPNPAGCPQEQQSYDFSDTIFSTEDVELIWRYIMKEKLNLTSNSPKAINNQLMNIMDSIIRNSSKVLNK